MIDANWDEIPTEEEADVDDQVIAIMTSCVMFGTSAATNIQTMKKCQRGQQPPLSPIWVRAWSQPKNIKELRGFLGLTGYYGNFIPIYARICAPLHQMTKKDGCQFSQVAVQAFHELKTTMQCPQVLALLDYNKPFYIDSDASGYGIGVVLH